MHRSILGYKCLTLLLSDGTSQLMLDFSLHGEKGKNKDCPYGLTNKECKSRFSEDHTGKAVEDRIKEYDMKKTDKAIEMVKYAIKRGIRFDYLLIDSWFTNYCCPLKLFESKNWGWIPRLEFNPFSYFCLC